jgi:hypothetical protein
MPAFVNIRVGSFFHHDRAEGTITVALGAKEIEKRFSDGGAGHHQ